MTDFGVDNFYVSEMKSVIYSLCREARIVDITHSITPFDVHEAAFLLGMIYPFYPGGGIFLVVVDPGVGGERGEIIVRTQERLFVGPDNGVFSYVYEKEKKFSVYRIRRELFEGVSSTFHGRDIFAPVAGRLLAGTSLRSLGRKSDEFVRFQVHYPEVEEQEGAVLIRGRVMFVDKFGNLISNITFSDLKREGVKETYIRVGRTVIREISRSFSDVPAGKPVAYIGSHGYLEIGVNKGNAQSSLGAGKGSILEVVMVM